MFSYLLEIAGHYLLIQSSIILFALPFFLLYRRGKRNKELTAGDINHQLGNFFLSREANYLVFFWAMGEALVWFVIPEFLLLLIVFMRVKKKWQLLTYDVMGTVAGTTVAFMLNVSDRTISNLPYIQEKMVEQTHIWFSQHGIWGLFSQPFSGVPYKVFTLLANQYDFFIIWFILLAVIIRMSRYFIFFGLFTALYPGLHNFVKKNYVKLFFAATFIFSVLLVRVVHNYQ